VERGKVFIAPPGKDEKRSLFFKEIISCCPEYDYSSVIYITPSSFNQSESQRDFFHFIRNISKRPVYIPFNSYTLSSYCTHIYDMYGSNYILSDRIAPMVICEVMGERNIGFARLLYELFCKFKHYILNKGLDSIKEDIENLIFEQKTLERAKHAIEILEVFEKKIYKNRQICFEDALRESCVFIDKNIHIPVLAVSDFFDPTPLELEVIRTLIKKSERVYLLVDENANFVRFLESYDNELEILKLKPSRARKTAGYYTFPSLEYEVDGIARIIKSKILNGIPPSDITVTFPSLQKYHRMVKRVFKKHGIPIDMEGNEISRSRPWTALDDLLSSIEKDYPRNEFLSFLTSPYFPGIPEIVRDWAIYFANRAGIVKSIHSWLNIKTILNSTPGDDGILEDNKILEDFQKHLKKIIDLLEDVRHSDTLTHCIDSIESVLDTLGFFTAFDDKEMHHDIMDTFIVIQEVFAELRRFAEQFRPEGRGLDTLSFYLRHIVQGITFRQGDETSVRIVHFEHAAGIESTSLYAGGMIEGDLPYLPGIDPILPEHVKKALGMPFREYYLDRQKRYFNRLINCSVNEPFFSCPSADGDNVFLPSPFLDWHNKLTPPETGIVTEEDILIQRGYHSKKDFKELLWNGVLPDKKETHAVLSRRYGQDKFLGITDIDTYRQCPLRFYIEKFLGLEIDEPPKFDVEAMVWGRLAHRTMEYLFKEGDVNIDEIERHLLRALDASLADIPVGTFWSTVARQIFQHLMPFIKEQEKNLRMDGFSPYSVEHTLKNDINGLKLKGKIDRIDKKFQIPNSKLKTQNSVILLDYKTGSADKDTLQLPLYAALWQKENNEIVEKTGFYSLKKGTVEWYPKKTKLMKEYIENAISIAMDIVKKMREGYFAPEPSDTGRCRTCYHSSMCKTKR
jgi:ATP-dependent helicase/DNAse subunit B